MNPAHFIAQLTGHSSEAVLKCHAACLEGKGYKSWRKSKPDGRYRIINEPMPGLKTLQHGILHKVLYKIPVSPAAHGFIPGRSIVTNAQVHVGAAEVFNIDLKDAFPTVSAGRLRTDLAHCLAWRDSMLDMLVDLVTWKNRLPQGGPCSGYLLNICAFDMDREIFGLTEQYPGEFQYTRYADDLTLSSLNSIPEAMRHRVIQIAKASGFKVSPVKTQYLKGAKQALTVTGLIINDGRPRIPRVTLDRYRAMLHKAAQNPDDVSEEKLRELRSIVSYVMMVYGELPQKLKTAKKLFEGEVFNADCNSGGEAVPG